jgi:general secretion pathway protein D
MTRLRLLLIVILAGATALPVVAESAEHDYKVGSKAEVRGNYDAAYQAFKRAHDLKPSDPKYMSAYLRMRFYAGAEHIRKGQELRDAGSLQEALAEFRLAAAIDASNFQAMGELARTTNMIQREAQEKENAQKNHGQPSPIEKEAMSAAGPVSLDIKWDTPISLHLTSTTVDVVYKTIAKIAGINVLIDPDYKPQKINFELQDVNLRQAMEMIAMQSKTFWRPVSSNTILVAADTGTKRKDLEQNVMKTFYLKNAATPADLQEAAGTLKGILDISRIQVTPELRSLTVRGTPDQMVLAQKLLADIDKPKPEVVIDVMVMEVSRNRLTTLGTNPPTSASVTLAPSGSSGSSSSGSGSSGLTLDSFTHLRAGDFAVSIPGISFSLLATDSNTKVIQRPEIRVLDSEKASLKIGDRVPIATGSFQSGFGGSVNTQFQYLDVGVNIDITPYVHADNEITLKMHLEISSVTGVENIGGFNQPTIGQRTVDHEARLRDGEVNLIAGILNDTESQSLSGYPGLIKAPILKYLFGQENKQRQQNEVVFAIIPHVVRGYDTNDDNLKEIDLGSGNTVTYRKAGTK